MAYREVAKMDMDQVIRRWLAGEKIRAIARSTGLDRNTIRRIVRSAEEVGVQREAPWPDEGKLQAIRERIGRPGTTVTSEVEQRLKPRTEQIRAWLEKDRLLLRCRGVAGQRINGTTRQVPWEVFEAEEKSQLIPLQGERFDTPTWAKCKVHPDHHVRFGQALYSVPTRWIRSQVDVRGDRSLVRIYIRGELIKTHERKLPGGRSTDYTDYPDGRAPYALRWPNYYCKRARELGAAAGDFTDQLRERRVPLEPSAPGAEAVALGRALRRRSSGRGLPASSGLRPPGRLPPPAHSGTRAGIAKGTPAHRWKLVPVRSKNSLFCPC